MKDLSHSYSLSYRWSARIGLIRPILIHTYEPYHRAETTGWYGVREHNIRAHLPLPAHTHAYTTVYKH
jgi:hypothetical protein